MAAQPPTSIPDETKAVIGRVRKLALDRLRDELTLAFDLKRPKRAEPLARVALAMIDGAFIASQADGVPLADIFEHLPVALIGVAGELI